MSLMLSKLTFKHKNNACEAKTLIQWVDSVPVCEVAPPCGTNLNCKTQHLMTCST